MACSENYFHAVIISTPTSNHITDLLEVLENKINNIYLEKPISHSLINLNNIAEKIDLSGANLVVGFDLHFDPGLILMKEYIDTNKIGKIVGFISEVGQYLPDWRPGTDYRSSMSADKTKGGGVMLDLIHEFDYINWLLGPIKKIAGKNKKNSNLEINTEDISVNLLETKSGVLGTLHLDYLQCQLSRTCKIIGDQGVIIWDYNERTVKFMSHEKKTWVVHDFKKYERNDRFKEIINVFMNSTLDTNDKRIVRFKEAIKSIQLVELSKKYNQHDAMEKL